MMRWCDDAMMRWCDDAMMRWWDDEMMRWWDDEMMRWWHDEMMRWWDDAMMRWCDDEMMRWWDDEMMSWWDIAFSRARDRAVRSFSRSCSLGAGRSSILFVCMIYSSITFYAFIIHRSIHLSIILNIIRSQFGSSLFGSCLRYVLLNASGSALAV